MKKILFILILASSIPRISGQGVVKHRCSSDKLLEKFLIENAHFQDTINSFPTSTGSFRSTNETEADFEIIIPIIFHVVYNSSTPTFNISSAQISSQLAALNFAFANGNSHTLGTNTKISFCLAITDPYGNILPEPGITRYSIGQDEYISETSDEILVKTIDYWPSNKYLNVWLCNFMEFNNGIKDDALGKSTFPFTNSSNIGNDGIIINSKYCGNNIGTAVVPDYNKGMTLVHEAGHWLGLFHVFQNQQGCDNCTGTNLQGDQIADTPPCKGPADDDSYWQSTNADQTKRNTCDINCNSVNPLISAENFMDYNYDQYCNFFTSGQKTRMRSMVNNYRNYFYTYSKNNPSIFPIECNGDKPSVPGPPDEGPPNPCPNYTFYYPDQQLMMNHSNAANIELCEGTHPIINVRAGCLKREWHQTRVACNTDGAYHCEGTCGISIDGKCRWICEQAGSCHCCTSAMQYHLTIQFNCDENFNCANSFSSWIDYSNVANTDLNIDVAADLGFDISQQNRYVIILGMNDANNVWRQGIKSVTYIPYDATIPSFKYNVTNAATTIKVKHNAYISNCLMPNNKTIVAGNQIAIQGESKFSGIESSLKIDQNIACSNSLKAGNLTNSTHTNDQVQNDHDLAQEYTDFQNYLKSQTNTKIQTSDHKIVISPNPSENGIFKIKRVSSDNIDRIEIYNSLGEKINFQYNRSENTINLMEKSSGIYFCNVIFNNGQNQTFSLILHKG